MGKERFVRRKEEVPRPRRREILLGQRRWQNLSLEEKDWRQREEEEEKLGHRKIMWPWRVKRSGQASPIVLSYCSKSTIRHVALASAFTRVRRIEWPITIHSCYAVG